MLCIACHVIDETYCRVRGLWLYLWRAVDQNGQLVAFRLTSRRDLKVARAILRQACENTRVYQPRTITTDKAHSYAQVISELNSLESPGEGIIHVSRKWENNRIESDHAALKKLITPMKDFKSFSSAKATQRGIETIRSNKHGHVQGNEPGVLGEIRFEKELFEIAA